MSGSTAFALVTVSTTGSPIITTDGAYTVVKFINGGSFNLTGGSLTADTLVIGGGGSGASAGTGGGNGGGGAGGYQYNTSVTISSGIKTVTIGAGGVVTNNSSGSQGGTSTFNGVSAIGGGAGGIGFGVNGGNGASGGGGGGYGGAGSNLGGTGSNGSNGGNGSNISTYGSGGGGGYSAPGGNGTASSNGDGGAGVSNSITGSAIFYAGGGGGGTWSGIDHPVGGAGGIGGGGAGASTGETGTPGTNGLGGGGGGGQSQNVGTANGGIGGSGVVIIRYLTSDAITTNSNLVAHYKMNDSAANTIVIDSVGVNNGTAQANTNTRTVSGKINNALSFNGTTDYITTTDTGFPAGTSSKSFSLWVKTSGSGVQGIFNYGTIALGNLFAVLLIDGNIYVGTAGDNFLTTGVSANNGQWHNIFVVDNSSNYSIYMDGIFITSAFLTTNTILTGSAFIGDVSSNRFIGAIDDFRIYDRALTADEISFIYNAGNGTESSLFPPSVSTVSPIVTKTQTSATLLGNISNTSGEDAFAIGFNYGTASTSLNLQVTKSGTFSTGDFSFNLSTSTLVCGTTYYYQAYANNSIGKGLGSIQSFTTSPCTFLDTTVNFSTTTLTSGITPRYVTSADFNQDGKPDLAVANQNSDNISIFIGNGDGTFQNHVTYHVGSSPLGVVSGDLNGDGKLDLVSANNGGTTISVLLGNGDGTFASSTNYTAGSNPFNVSLGDFNNDNKLDIAATNQGTSTVSVFLGNGDGTFQTQSVYAVGAAPFGLISVDLNNDGNLDLAVSNAGTSTASILLGNGDGTFQTQTILNAQGGPRAVTSADYNNDGKVDLIVMNHDSSSISVFLGNGDGTFQAPTVYSDISIAPFFIISADLNNDGILDLAIVKSFSTSVGVLLGNGDGTFQSQKIFTVGSLPTGVIAADFNQDGKVDLAVANEGGDVTVLLAILLPPTVPTVTTTVAPATPIMAHWKLNDSAADTIVVDDIGNNNGTASQNTNGLSVEGKINSALSFDGSTVNITTTDTGFPTGNKSISAWIKTSTHYEYQIIFKYGTAGNLGEMLFIAVDNQGNIFLTNWGQSIVSNGIHVDDGQWHDIVVTNSGNSYTIYIDGVSSGSGTMVTNTVLDGTAFIGDSNDGGSPRKFTGSIDDVAIYNTALSQSAVSAIYNNGNGTENENVVSVEQTTAVLRGNLTDIGSTNVTTTGFHYSTSSDLSTFIDQHTGSQNISGAPVIFSESISGLACNTIYYYQGYAVNSVGTSTGSIQNFTTGHCSTLTITTGITPISHYKMNDSASNTHIIDDTNTNNGTAQANTDTLSVAGKVNGALSFNGTSDYITTTDNGFPIGTSSRSFSAWIKTTSSDTQQIFKYGSGGSATFEVAIVGNGTVIGYGSGNGASVSTPVNDGQWHNIIVTYDSSNYFIYVDGVSQGSNFTSPTNTILSGTATIGTGDVGYGNFSGDIDDVRIYDRTLTTDQVSLIYNSGNGTEVSSLPLDTIGQTSATLLGLITNIGLSNVTTTGFNYGTDSLLSTSNDQHTDQVISNIPADFHEDISGLTCNTTYYYQSYAVNTSGTATGTIESFTTSLCLTSIPTITTVTPLLTIGQNSATLLGNISDIGSSSVTTTGFNYGTDSLLSTSTDQHTDQVISSAPADFHEDISGLTCNTTYYYQAYAVNDTGTSTGNIENFLTSSCPVVAGSYTSANFIQTGNTTRSGTTNISVNFSSQTTIGNTLILVLAANGNTSISTPSGFTQIENSSGSASQAIFYKVTAGGEQNFNLNGRFSTNPGVIAAHIYEYSGEWTFAFIGGNSTIGSGTTLDTANSSTDLINNELIFGAVVDGQPSSNFNSNNTSWPIFSERSDFITTSNNNATRRAGFSAGDLLTNTANTQYEDNPIISQSANWAGQIVRFHRNAPRVLSIIRNNSTLTNASSVDYTVTFSSPVTGVDAGDFNLNTSGVSGASISSVSSDSGSIRTVTIDTGSGDGTIELDSVNDSSIVDEAGQTLTNTFSGQVYTIDKIQPEVSSIVRNAASPTTSGTVSWNITFSESVSSVNSGDFDVTTVGGSVGTLNINSVTRISSTVYRVVVNTSTGDGEIRLDVRSDSDISDLAGNLLSNLPYQAGQTYIIDNTTPTLLSATTSASLINLASSGTFTATAIFSESMNTGVTPNFSFNPNLTNGGSPLLSFSSGSWTTTTLTNDTYIATYNLNASHALESSVTTSVSGARDLAGNQMSTTPDGNFTVDTIAPYLLSAQWTDVDNSGTINVADTVSLTFREMMNTGTTVDDTSFTLGGGHTFDITGASTPPAWSDSSTLVITLGASETVVSGDSIVPASTFLDTHDNPAVSSPTAVLISDNIAPQVSSIVRVTDSSPTNSSAVHYTVTFSESVTGVDTSDFSLTTSGVSGASVSSVTPVSASIYTVEVNTGSGSGTIRLDVDSAANIVDVGNNLLSNIPFTSGDTYTIDKTKPVVSSVDSDSQTFNAVTASPHKITMTFSKDLNVAPVVSVSSVSQTVYDCGDSDDKTFCFDFTILPSTESTETIDISAGEDSLGNIMDADTSHTFIVDSLSPTVSSVAWVPANGDTFISAGDSVVITFSEAMDKTTINSSNVDSRLGLNNGHTFGTTGAGMSAVWNTPGTVLTITLGSDMTVEFLDTVDPTDSVTDIAGNADNTSSPLEITDSVGPAVTVNQANSQSDPTNGSTINFTVTFSEPVSDFTTDDVTLSGTAGATIAVVTGTSTIYNIAVSGMVNDGTVIASINAGVATDTSNNTNATSTSADNTVTYDTTAPGLPTASLSPGTYTGAHSTTLSSAGSLFIRYTTDNITDPTCSIGTSYGGAFSISSSETVRAVGCDAAGNISAVASFAYTINAAPVITGGGGGFSGGGGGGGGSGVFIPPFTGSGTTTVSTTSTTTANLDYLTHLVELLKLYLLALQALGQPIPAGLESFLPASTPTANINFHYQFAFTKILKFGMTDDEVKHLQAFLNTHGFSVAVTGVGSLGHETNYFGLKTKQALIKFQEAYAKDILIPQGFTSGTGIFGVYSKKIVNLILASEK